jgi:type I restriction enzyme S subunit
MATNQGFKSLIPGPEVDPRYLYRVMRYVTPSIIHLGRGATFKEVSKEIVEQVEIPLPSLPEQRRIAALLDKADAIRRKRQRAMVRIEDFLRSVFLDMFGDPVTNPNSYPRYCLRELSDGNDGIKCGPFGTQLFHYRTVFLSPYEIVV